MRLEKNIECRIESGAGRKEAGMSADKNHQLWSSAGRLGWVRGKR